MGVGDLKNHLLKKVTKPDGVAGTISCCTCIVGIAFFLITFLVGIFTGPGIGGNFLLSSLVVDGMKQNPPVVPYPQIVFCPLWDDGVITDIHCFESNTTWFNEKFPMQANVVKSGRNGKPNWKCYGYNTDGKTIPSADYTVWCKMNSTNSFNGTSWDGRVRVYVDVPGTKDFTECQNCVDGIDGTILIKGTTTLGFFQANVVDTKGSHVVDYRTQSNRMPTQPQLGEISDMDAVFGFYSMDVWMFRNPSDFSTTFAGERFGRFVAFVGGLAIASWGLYACLNAFLVLLVVGEDGYAATSGEKRSLLP